MHALVSILLGLLAGFEVVVNWGLGWRYILSATFRKSVSERWRSKGHGAVLSQAAFAGVCFIAINLAVALLFWRMLIGPILPIHEW
jgi:hypothetical protein